VEVKEAKPIPEPSAASDYETQLSELAEKVALAQELAKDGWWDDHYQRSTIELFIKSKYRQIGELVFSELLKNS
jgi:hypothetical protein